MGTKVGGLGEKRREMEWIERMNTKKKTDKMCKGGGRGRSG